MNTKPIDLIVWLFHKLASYWADDHMLRLNTCSAVRERCYHLQRKRVGKPCVVTAGLVWIVIPFTLLSLIIPTHIWSGHLQLVTYLSQTHCTFEFIHLQVGLLPIFSMCFLVQALSSERKSPWFSSTVWHDMRLIIRNKCVVLFNSDLQTPGCLSLLVSVDRRMKPSNTSKKTGCGLNKKQDFFFNEMLATSHFH